MKQAVVIALIFAAAALAGEVGGFGGPMVIGGMPDFDDLNAELANYNCVYFGGSRGPGFSSPAFFIGGQGKGFMSGFCVGGWGGGFFQEANGDSSKAVIGYGMGYAEFSYHLNIADVLLVGPAVQLGGGGLGLHIGRYRAGGGFGSPDGDGDDNDDFLDDDESYDIGKGFVNVGGAAEATLLFPLNERKTAFGGLNVKGGYLYAIYDSDWYDEHGGVVDRDAVKFNMNGPFISVSVVFGGMGCTHEEGHGCLGIFGCRRDCNHEEDEDKWEGW